MNELFPEVSMSDIAPSLSPLAWVGMQGIDLPITVAEYDYQIDLHRRPSRRAGQSASAASQGHPHVPAIPGAGFAGPVRVAIARLGAFFLRDINLWATCIG